MPTLAPWVVVRDNRQNDPTDTTGQIADQAQDNVAQNEAPDAQRLPGHCIDNTKPEDLLARCITFDAAYVNDIYPISQERYDVQK